MDNTEIIKKATDLIKAGREIEAVKFIKTLKEYNDFCRQNDDEKI